MPGNCEEHREEEIPNIGMINGLSGDGGKL
jgi:hypothetical protein